MLTLRCDTLPKTGAFTKKEKETQLSSHQPVDMDEFVIKYNETSPATLEARAAAMTKLEQVCASQVQWYEFESPAQYRKMRSEGTNGFPKPQLWEGARNIQIQTRDGHSMELRIIDPLRTKNAVLLHFHAGS